MQHLDIDHNEATIRRLSEIDIDLIAGPIRRAALRLIYMFIFMALGAMFYSSHTETLDNCRALYEGFDLSKLETEAKNIL